VAPGHQEVQAPAVFRPGINHLHLTVLKAMGDFQCSRTLDPTKLLVFIRDRNKNQLLLQLQ
jgi:hypothetical protein